MTTTRAAAKRARLPKAFLFSIIGCESYDPGQSFTFTSGSIGERKPQGIW